MSAKAHLGREHASELLRQMRLIRRFEEACAEQYTKEKIRGFLHLYIGEEANAVGVLQALGPEDAVVAVETQKGAIEIEAYEDGVLAEIRVGLGERVPVGTVLAIIRGAGEPAATPEPALSTPPAATVAPSPVVPPSPPVPAATPAPSPSSTGFGARRVSPAAVRRAQALGLGLETITPGRDGIIGLREVEQAMASSPAPAGQGKADPASEMRRAIAAAMSRSWREIPHYFVASRLDVEAMLGWLAAYNAERPPPERLHYSALLAKAVALALRAVPALNGQYVDGQAQLSKAVHLGIAVAQRGGGLIAPAIRDADSLSLPDLMRELGALVERVRGGRLRSGEMGSGTATLSNLGEESADRLQPIIQPPQLAIIGCGHIAARAVPKGDAIVVRRCLDVTVGGDHRASDGRAGARFLIRLQQLLDAPESL